MLTEDPYAAAYGAGRRRHGHVGIDGDGSREGSGRGSARPSRSSRSPWVMGVADLLRDLLCTACLAYRGFEVSAEVIDGDAVGRLGTRPRTACTRRRGRVVLLLQHAGRRGDTVTVAPSRAGRQQRISEPLWSASAASSRSSSRGNPLGGRGHRGHGRRRCPGTSARSVPNACASGPMYAVPGRAATFRSARPAADPAVVEGRLRQPLPELLVSPLFRQPGRPAHPTGRRKLPGLGHRPPAVALTSSAPSPVTTRS